MIREHVCATWNWGQTRGMRRGMKGRDRRKRGYQNRPATQRARTRVPVPRARASAPRQARRWLHKPRRSFNVSDAGWNSSSV